jgi:hypothetical protein
MRHAFAIRFAAVVTFALSECSLASADPPKVVTTLQQTQVEVTRAVASSEEQFTREAEISDRECQIVKNIICLIPGHMIELPLDWDVRSIHVGDEKLIEVTPEGNGKLLVKALGVTTNDEEKRKRAPVTGTNFYVFGANNKEVWYEVRIRNYYLPLRPKTSDTVEIHNKKTLSDSTDYECENHTGCKLSAKLSGGEAPTQ